MHMYMYMHLHFPVFVYNAYLSVYVRKRRDVCAWMVGCLHGLRVYSMLVIAV